MRKRRSREPEVRCGGVGASSPRGCLPPQGLRRHPGSWGQARAPWGAAGRGKQAVRSTREGERRREPDRGGRVSSGHRRPRGLEGDAFQGHTLRRLPSAPARVGGHKASEGGAGTWGPFFRQEEEHPSHQRGIGAVWRADPGQRRRPLAPQPAVPAQHRGREEGRRGRAGGVSSVIPWPARSPEGSGAASGAGGSSADLSPSPWPGPGPSTKCSSRGVQRTKKRKNPPSPQEQHRKAL